MQPSLSHFQGAVVWPVGVSQLRQSVHRDQIFRVQILGQTQASDLGVFSSHPFPEKSLTKKLARLPTCISSAS